jgi:hypothetical protein
MNWQALLAKALRLRGGRVLNDATELVITTYVVQPLVGVGPVLLGMTRDEVRQVMPEKPRPFQKTPNSKYEVDAFHGSAFQVFYGGEQPVVEYIELSGGLRVRALYGDLDVFATPADEVIARISVDADHDKEDPELPYAYIFPGLQLALWRPRLPEDDGDEDGRYFATIGIDRNGYFDK